MISVLGVFCTAVAASVAAAGLVAWLGGRGGTSAATTGLLVFLWWVPAVSGSAGLLLGDPVSAGIGLALWCGGGVAVLACRTLYPD